MTYQLKYRGIPFTYQSFMPIEAVKEVRFRRRSTILSSPKAVATPVKDVQFFGWHTAGLAPA